MSRSVSAKNRSKLRRQNPAVAYALERGWSLTHTRNGHVRMSKNGQSVVTGTTPSDQRSVKNALAQVKRAERSMMPTPPPTPATPQVEVQTLTFAEAAELLGVGIASVKSYTSPKNRRLVRHGDGVTVESLEAYMSSRGQRETTKARRRKVTAPPVRVPGPAATEASTEQPPTVEPEPSTAPVVDVKSAVEAARQLGRLEVAITLIPEPQRAMAEEALVALEIHLQESTLIGS